MKRFSLFVLLFALTLAACAPQAAPATTGPTLKVSDGTTTKTYTADDLKALGAVEVTSKDVIYVGVTLTALLQDAGIDPTALKAVKAVASDGFSANYEPALFTLADTILAYATTTGDLSAEEAPFRMVLPAEGGKLNPRMIVEILAIP